MIRDKRVTLVLGAGASHPYGFPLGEALKDLAVDQIGFGQGRTNISRDLYGYLPDFRIERAHLSNFGSELGRSRHLSIDAFLEDRPEFMSVGKLVLAANLISSEVLHELEFRDKANSTGKWYDYLLNLLGNRDEFTSNKLSIITFNYDRSLEYFFFRALSARFGLDPQETKTYYKAIPIIHVYGQLGEPDFLIEDGRAYDPNRDVPSLKKSIDGIRLIHEKAEGDVTPGITAAHDIIRKTDLLVFIGFGFHAKNLERLKLREFYNGEQIVATLHGRREGEVARAANLIREYSISGRGNVPIVTRPESALDFLRNTNYLT